MQPKPMNAYSRTRMLTTLAILSSIAYVLWAVARVPMLSAGPLVLRYDPGDVILAFAGFIFGPMAVLAMSIVVAFAQMVTISETGLVGFVMNVISSVSFVCVAAYVYKKQKSLKGAVLGLILGILLMTAVMMLWNFILTPIFMNQPRERVIPLLATIFLPFNLIKGTINAALILILYKPLIRALRSARMLPERELRSENPVRINIGVVLVACLVLITCVLVVLILQGVI